MYAIEANDLHKSFGKVEVLKALNLEVDRGSLVALLGPNGAGKTTTVRILATLLRFDSGRARVFGHDVVKEADAVRRRVSLTGQYASVDDDLTGLENLVLVARLLGFSWGGAKRRAAELIEAFDLNEAARRQVKHYSGGMRRRLDLAASLVVSPDLLFLDEPTTGLDPRSRRAIWDIIRELRAAGTTVLLTTQYLDEADALADRIVIIDQGAMVADGTPEELKASFGARVLRLRLDDAALREEAQRVLDHIPGIETQQDPDPAELSAQAAGHETVAAALTALSAAGISLAEFALGQPSLDDVFLALTERDAGREPAAQKETAR